MKHLSQPIIGNTYGKTMIWNGFNMFQPQPSPVNGPGSFADAGHVYVHIRTGVIGEQVGGGEQPTSTDPGVGLLKICYPEISWNWNLGGSSTFCLSFSIMAFYLGFRVMSCSVHIFGRSEADLNPVTQ